MQERITGLLRVFALMAEDDAIAGGDTTALERLKGLMDRQDPFLLLTKDGPKAYALLQHFGLIGPTHDQSKLDALDPELVCKTLVAFELWRHSILELDHADHIMMEFNPTYTDKITEDYHSSTSTHTDLSSQFKRYNNQ